MNLLEISYNHIKYPIQLDQCKVLIGNNHPLKYLLMKTLFHIIEKESFSDYEEEHNTSASVLFNEQKLEAKRWSCYLAHAWFDFNEDIKLGSKSLLTQYTESALREIEFEDSFNMLNQSIQALNDDFIQEKTSKQVGNYNLDISLKGINIKNLVKMLQARILLDDCEIIDNDLDYFSKIKFQFILVNSIAKKNMEKNFLVVVEVSSLNEETYDYLTKEIAKNMYILILTDDLRCKVDYHNIAIIGKEFIDLNDECALFEKMIVEYGIENDTDALISKLNELFSNPIANKTEIYRFMYQ